MARRSLAVVAGLGVAFLVIKGCGFAALQSLGICIDASALFMFGFLLTGFHAAHFLARVIFWLCWRSVPALIWNAANQVRVILASVRCAAMGLTQTCGLLIGLMLRPPGHCS